MVSLKNAPVTLKSFTLLSPSLVGQLADLPDDLLCAIAVRFPHLEELRIMQYRLTAAVDPEASPPDAPDTGPQSSPWFNFATMPNTLRKLVLHCDTSHTYTASEAWAMELAQLSNLTELDLGTGVGSWFCPTTVGMGMTVPWTPAVADAWRAGFKQLQRLSVRLMLCLNAQGHAAPLQTHGSPLPVNTGTTHLAVFFMDFEVPVEDAAPFQALNITHATYTRAALAVLVGSLEACGERLRSLEVRLDKFPGTGVVFGAPLDALLLFADPATAAVWREAKALVRRLAAKWISVTANGGGGISGSGSGGRWRLQSLSLSLDAAALLTPALQELLSSGPDAVGTFTLTLDGSPPTLDDFLSVLSLLHNRVVHLSVSWDRQLIDMWAQQRQAEHDGELLSQQMEAVMETVEEEVREVLGGLRSLKLSLDSYHALPAVGSADWRGHVLWMRGLGQLQVLRALHLSFGLCPVGAAGRRLHEVSDINASLDLVAAHSPQLEELSVHVTEDFSPAGRDNDKEIQSQRLLANWRAARKAANAGHDLDRWRPRGAFNPVPDLQMLAAMPALRRLDLVLDVANLFGVSGMVEDGVRLLLEARLERWREAGGDSASWGRRPLRVWCPQLSREAARRLSRLAAELLQEAEKSAATKSDGSDGDEDPAASPEAQLPGPLQAGQDRAEEKTGNRDSEPEVHGDGARGHDDDGGGSCSGASGSVSKGFGSAGDWDSDTSDEDASSPAAKAPFGRATLPGEGSGGSQTGAAGGAAGAGEVRRRRRLESRVWLVDCTPRSARGGKL